MQQSASNEALRPKMGVLAGSVVTSEADPKTATVIRQKKHRDLEAPEKEAWTITDALFRTTNIIEKEMNGGVSMMLLRKSNGVVAFQDLHASTRHPLCRCIQGDNTRAGFARPKRCGRSRPSTLDVYPSGCDGGPDVSERCLRHNPQRSRAEAGNLGCARSTHRPSTRLRSFTPPAASLHRESAKTL